MKMYRKLTLIALCGGLISLASCKEEKDKEGTDVSVIAVDTDTEDSRNTNGSDLDTDANTSGDSYNSNGDASSSNKSNSTQETIAAKAMANNNLSTLVTALKAAGLAETFSNPGSYTVFAPIDDAFSALPQGTLDNLLKSENKEQLAAVLKYHVVKGVIDSEKLANAIQAGGGSYKVTTLNGGVLTATMNGKQIYLTDKQGNKAQVVLGNVNASNGIVHAIDKVLMQ